MMKKLFSIVISILLLCFAAAGQEAGFDLIRENPSRIANQMHRYEPGPISDTKAPAGYKAFYVSHIGRHGSRYLSSPKKYDHIVSSLGQMHSAGILTSDGEKLKAVVDAVAEAHNGMDGFLTQIGSREHQEIAARLYDRCPSIFNQKDRNKVLALSSTVVRCNQSMTNFCTSLKGKAPGLQFSFYTALKTDAIVRAAKGRRLLDNGRDADAVLDSVLNARMDVGRMMDAFFSDKEKAVKMMPGQNAKQFFFDAIYIGLNEQCIDVDVPKIYGLFTVDELYAYWRVMNASTLKSHGFCYETGLSNARRGQVILRDFMEKAEDALRPDSDKAADFRFSHDSQTLPFVFFLGLKDNDRIYHMGREAEEGWFGFRNICMGSNVQMIFYKNKKNDILVKFLHNERETTITALEPYSGPYYKWTELKPYLESKLADQLD